ncbi:hypothetical protein E2C01_052674 [Portunus trituberculatus]|uniref:Uncharacterized protein n=1 Tax=Portunus trituberculatus TaxID=210409 RepID=A0A5B7GN50_PORTR|nr:hypothetical protein [Portunus trituberculatus]
MTPFPAGGGTREAERGVDIGLLFSRDGCGGGTGTVRDWAPSRFLQPSRDPPYRSSRPVLLVPPEPRCAASQGSGVVRKQPPS